MVKQSNTFKHYATLSVIYGAGIATFCVMGASHIVNAYGSRFVDRTSSHTTHSHAHAPDASHDDCAHRGRHITLNIGSDGFTPATISAERCDLLIIMNTDSKPHRPALGAHDRHTAYPGFEDMDIQPRDTRAIILVQSGNYRLHDHYDESVAGSPTIAP